MRLEESNARSTAKARNFATPALCLALSAALIGNPIATQAQAPVSYPSTFATPLPVDRGAAAVLQSLQKLHTRASLILIVAHPDDEDSGMLAYEARDKGVDTTLLTLNRGEGGQNVMSSDYWDQLGLLRTQELLAAGDGKLDPADYERTVTTLLTGGSDPVITRKPTGAWTHKVYDAMK